jgi:hypothetical protein
VEHHQEGAFKRNPRGGIVLPECQLDDIDAKQGEPEPSGES